MRLAVPQGVGNVVDVVSPPALSAWVNREARTLHEQLRRAANAINPEKPDAVTSDGSGTYATLWTSPEMPEDCSWQLTASISGSGGGERATYVLVTTMTSVAGVIAPLGVTTLVHAQESDAACDARFAYDAALRTVIVEARDNGSTAMRWTATVCTAEGSSEP